MNSLSSRVVNYNMISVYIKFTPNVIYFILFLFKVQYIDIIFKSIAALLNL